MLFHGNLLAGLQPSTLTVVPKPALGRMATGAESTGAGSYGGGGGGGGGLPNFSTLVRAALTPAVLPDTAPPSSKQPPGTFPGTHTAPPPTPSPTPAVPIDPESGEEITNLPTAPSSAPDASASAPFSGKRWMILGGLGVLAAATTAYLLYRRR